MQSRERLINLETFTGKLGVICIVFFFNGTATTEIYTLSLHDALPICLRSPVFVSWIVTASSEFSPCSSADRKSTRLNSSHPSISYAVFCLKKKKSNMPDLFTHKSNTWETNN